MRLDPQRLQYWAHWYLSEVWLEQAERRRNGAYVKYPVCEPEAWNGDFYQVRPRPDEAIITKHPMSERLDLVMEVEPPHAYMRRPAGAQASVHFPEPRAPTAE